MARLSCRRLNTARMQAVRPAVTAALAALALAAAAAPHRPSSDQQVLVKLPAGASDARSREITTLRRQLQAQPRQPDLALKLAQLHLARLAADGDPRDAGQAQAALAPWWNDSAPPPDIRVARAVLRQFGHDFDGALADLQAVVQADPGHVQAWAWINAISLVQAHYDRARQACAGMGGDDELQDACNAVVDAATGQARQAAARFDRLLAGDLPPPLRLWLLTRLAETHERLGDSPAAERAWRAALALGLDDSYLRAGYADFLLEQGRPAEVLALLQGREANDLHLLRLALAGRALKHPRAADWQAQLAARFDAARQRGDTAHQKEEARFALQLLGDAARALPLARANYAVQREAADALVLLQAALAARDKAAAQPVLDWLQRSRFEHPQLAQLARQVQALP